jgi:hypothetical protein
MIYVTGTFEKLFCGDNREFGNPVTRDCWCFVGALKKYIVKSQTSLFRTSVSDVCGCVSYTNILYRRIPRIRLITTFTTTAARCVAEPFYHVLRVGGPVYTFLHAARGYKACGVSSETTETLYRRHGDCGVSICIIQMLQSADGVCFISRGAAAGRCVLKTKRRPPHGGTTAAASAAVEIAAACARMRNTSTRTQQYYIIILYTQ